MGKLKISKDEVREYEKLKVISQMAAIKSKIELFNGKYRCTFEEFEINIRTKDKEDFEAWDDYMEWKAYVGALAELEEKFKEIDNAQDIAVT